MSGRRMLSWGVLILAVLSMGMAQSKLNIPPEFSIQTLDGKKMEYEALKGQPVVIVFGATWCPECPIEARHVQQAYLAYRDRGVLFLGVYGGHSELAVREFSESCKITFPAGRDDGHAVLFSVRVIPTVLFFSSDGRLVKRSVGTTSFERISSTIDSILDENNN